MPSETNVIVIPAKSKAELAPNRPLNTAAYCRVSTTREEQENSYEAQVRFFTDKIAGTPNLKLAGIFADSISGTQAEKRDEFMKMIKLCRKGKIDVILAKSISRFARNTLDSLNYVRELKTLGIRVIFIKENLDTLEDTKSEMMFTILASFAQAESESISQNVTWGIRESYREGKVKIKYAGLLGYEKGADGKPKIIPEEAETVKFVFRRYLDGLSQIQIIEELTAGNYKNKKGNVEWSPTAVSRMLTNEKMVGDVILQKYYTLDCLSHKIKKNNGELPKYIVKNNHDAIISRETFDKVQSEMARRRSKCKVAGKTAKTENGKYSAKYALTELMFCTECGTPYRRVTWTSKSEKEIVWRCINRLQYGKKYCKKSSTIREEKLHEAIVRAINNFFDVRKDVAEMLKCSMSSVIIGGDFEAVSNAEQRIITLQGETKSLVEKCTADINFNDCQAEFKRLSDEIKSLQEFITGEKFKNQNSRKNETRLAEIMDMLERDESQIEKFDDVTVRHLIERVNVKSKSEIEIVFKGGYSVGEIME